MQQVLWQEIHIAQQPCSLSKTSAVLLRVLSSLGALMLLSAALASSAVVPSGTLKLLYEDVISKLKAEGKRELAFGFAPFFNVRDDRFSNIAHWIRWSVLYLYHCANNLYAFQNLAFSKIR